MSTRLNININDETANAIRQWQSREARNATEIVRRSISIYDYIQTQRYEHGATFLMELPNGEQWKIEVL